MSREQALLQALRDIADPLAALRRRAEAEGGRLSGMAYSISRDPAHLQGIAIAALRAYEADKP